MVMMPLEHILVNKRKITKYVSFFQLECKEWVYGILSLPSFPEEGDA
jgi:hypothetical protein